MIRSLLRRSAAMALGLLVPGLLAAQTPAPAARATDPAALLTNGSQPVPGLLTGGAPVSADGFRALYQAGYRTYVDLRSDAEVTPEFQAAAEAAGLKYRRVPVSGAADLNLGKARALDALLDESKGEPAAVACASGERVGALLALKAFWLDGASPEDALALGRKAGLTRLEPSVRTLLSVPAAQAPAPPR